MKNQGHWNESFEDPRSDEGDATPPPFSSRSSQQQYHAEEARMRQAAEMERYEEQQLQIPQAILQSSRQGGNGSWQEGESSRQQQQPPPQQMEMGAEQTYYRIGPNGEREVIRVTAISPPLPNQVTAPVPLFGPPQQQLPPHFPPSPRMSHPPPQKSSQYKSLDNLRVVTQQSFAPSQKTIVLNHISNQINGGVYHSHVSTERMPMQPQREPNTRHSHVHDARIGSPARVSFDYAQNKPEAGRNALFSSYIPKGPQAIPERGGAVSTSNAPQPSERQYQHPDEAIFWREKYEQLSRRWQATRLKQGKQQQVAMSKFAALEKNYQLLQGSYNQLVQDYHTKLDQNQQYFQQIQQLQGSINQLQLTPKRVEGEQGLQTALEEKSMLVGLLRKENQQFQAHLQDLQQRHEQEMREMHQHATMLQMEIQQREAQLRQRTQLKTSNMRRSDNSQLMLDRSRMESFENTRVMELQMHVGKLNSQLNMREESFQRQLRLANLNVAELVQKLKTLASEKDQFIRNLQEKVGLLQSDLNKKDSLIRNLRDQAVSRPSAPAASVYSSAVNPVDHRMGERQQAFKRELQNVRRNLFEREREKMILKQKYEQLEQKVEESEEALNRRKVENQSMRRQLNEYDNLQHENQKLMEVLNKKNAELLEIKEMLLEKEQHAGDFENLSKENDRLRSFMLKKNEQLSDLSERLYDQQKRARELQLAHTPQLDQMEEQLHRLQEMLARKDVEISKLNQSLELVQGNFSEIQFQLQRHRNINQEYQAQIKTNMARLHTYQDEIDAIQHEKHNLEVEVNTLRNKVEEHFNKMMQKEQGEREALRKVQELTNELQERRQQMENITLEQLQLKQFKQKSTKQIQLFQHKQGDLQIRCRDLESLLRNREQRLAKAEREAEQGRQQLKKHHNCAKQIEQMTEKISHYEMRLISLTLNRSSSGLCDYPPPSEIFENKLIYNLKRENQALRGELGTFKSQPSNTQQQSSEKGSDIKVRLDQFSNNLQSAIGGGLKRVRSVQAFQSVERADKESTIMQQNRQIQRLKQLAQEMQQQQMESSFTSRKRKITPEHIEQLYQEQLAFYRTKNTELEDRVTNLLKINKELKQQLEETLIHKSNSLKTFYQAEVKRLQKEIAQLKTQKSRNGDAIRANQRRIRDLQQQLTRQKKRQAPQEISYNFSLLRPGSMGRN